MDKKAITRTSAHLRELLSTRPAYVEKWRARVDRNQPRPIHQGAVCHVVADYLWANGLHPAADTELPRRLKDRVYRAIGGQSLSRATLRWFIEAFAMTPEDTAALLRLSSPSRAADTVLGGLVLEPGTLPPRRHTTVSLQEWHRIGPDGMPESHRTVQAIRADQDMDRIPYMFDTDAASVEVVRGGRSAEAYALSDGMFAFEVKFDRPLPAGQTTTLEYVTHFWHRTPPPQEFRLMTTHTMAEVELHVAFHHLRLPSAVWWCTWEGIAGDPLTTEPVTLDADKAVHRRLTDAPPGVVGFRWTIAQHPRAGS